MAAASFVRDMAALALMSAFTNVPSNIIEDVILPVSAVLIKLPEVGSVREVVPVVVKVSECPGSKNVFVPEPAVAWIVVWLAPVLITIVEPD